MLELLSNNGSIHEISGYKYELRKLTKWCFTQHLAASMQRRWKFGFKWRLTVFFFKIKIKTWKGAWESLQVVDHGKEPWSLSWVRRKVKTGGKQAVIRKKKRTGRLRNLRPQKI